MIISGRRDILSKLKKFTYRFSIFNDYYLVGFDDVILDIPYMDIKHTVVIPPHSFDYIKPYFGDKVSAVLLDCDSFAVDIYSVVIYK